MESEEKKISNFLNTGQKIITLVILLGGAFVSVIVAYLKIISNEADIKILREEFEKAFIIHDERSDKRFQRATEWNNQSLTAEKELDRRLRIIEQDVSHNKGLHDGLKVKQ
jgi:hypothetical protein